MPRSTPLRRYVALIAAMLLTWHGTTARPAEGVPPPKPASSPPASTQPASRPTSQASSQPAPVQTGHFRLTFTEKSPHSDTAAIAKRMGWTMGMIQSNGSPMDYDIANESFEAYVPAAYTGAEPYGLLVWINPMPSGKITDKYLPVIDRHKLIVIGPNNAGNGREIWNRMALALDAAHNGKSRFNIDPRRVYVSGLSGGGRTSSLLGLGYPDVFRGGGCYIIGCDYFRKVEVDPATHDYYYAKFVKPAPPLLALARDRSRHVLLTGETDPNRLQTKLNAAAMGEDGFRHVTYLEQPGLGHAAPSPEWFEKAMAALDQPETLPPATAPAAAKPPPANAGPPAKRPATAAQEAEAAKEFRLAKLYVQNRLYTNARVNLKDLINAHPDTAAASEAQTLLNEIGPE